MAGKLKNNSLIKSMNCDLEKEFVLLKSQMLTDW